MQLCPISTVGSTCGNSPGKIAPRQAGEAWDWLTWRHIDATPEEFAKAEATVIRENHVELYAEKTNLGVPLPWERNQLIREQVHRDRTLHKARVELAITTILPRKIHDKLRAGGYEVMADDRAGVRVSLGADILTCFTPDLLKRQLVSSGGAVYNNVVIREAKTADPPLPVSSPAEPPREANTVDAPLPLPSPAEPSAMAENIERRPGRPTVMRQIGEEMQRRARAQPCELYTSMRAESLALFDWARTKFKENVPTSESIRTNGELAKLHKDLKRKYISGVEK